MKKIINMENISKGIMGGILIAIASVVYLYTIVSVDGVLGRVLGSFLFSFGLLFIVNQKYLLFTGMMATPPRKLEDVYKILLILLLNFVGVILITGLVGSSLASFSEKIIERASSVVGDKTNRSIPEITMSGIFCGMFITFAVLGFKNKSSNLLVMFSVFLFVFLGFDHCIANMAYCALLENVSINEVKLIFFSIFGNVIGGLLFALLDLSTKGTEDEKKI